MDAMIKYFPEYSPYLFAGNRPIICIDVNGDHQYTVTVNMVGGTIVLSVQLTQVGGPDRVVLNNPAAIAGVNANDVSRALLPQLQNGANNWRLKELGCNTPSGVCWEPLVDPNPGTDDTRQQRTFNYTPRGANNNTTFTSRFRSGVRRNDDISMRNRLVSTINNLNVAVQNSNPVGTDMGILNITLTTSTNNPQLGTIENTIIRQYNLTVRTATGYTNMEGTVNFTVAQIPGFTNGGAATTDYTLNAQWTTTPAPTANETTNPAG